MDRELLKIILDLEPAGTLCSVIESHGSVPRRDFPVMVVEPGGEIHGTIGGGSLEYSIIERGKGLGTAGRAEVIPFQMNNDQLDAEGGVCGGRLKVLVEPLTPDLRQILGEAADVHAKDGEYSLLLRITDGPEPRIEREIIPDRELVERLPRKFKAGDMRARTQAYHEADDHWVVYSLSPGPQLHIFGAGHVGQAVARQAAMINLDVVVYDDRPELLTVERFPEAQCVEVSPGMPWETRPCRDQDFVVIASREHRHDRVLLEKVLANPPAYVGLLASKRKWQLMLEHLRQQGIPESLLASVHAPVGLAINAQTVPEIAVSIMAEIIASYRKGS